MDIEQLRKDFIYKDGKLYKVKECLGKTMQGYISCRYNKKILKGHRIIFFLHHGYLPEIVDHIDGDKTNNNIENLRAATKFENARNKATNQHKAEKQKNIFWLEKPKRYEVRVMANYKTYYIGRYTDLKSAQLAAIKAREKYHGNFACHR